MERLKQIFDDEEWGELAKDDRYIAFFAGRTPPRLHERLRDDPTLLNTKKFLRPAQALAGCLLGYVDIFPDSQLLLVDIKPIIQWFFRLHAKSIQTLRTGRIDSREQKDGNQKDALEFRSDILIVRDNVLKSLDVEVPISDDTLIDKLNTYGTLTKEREIDITKFVSTCGQKSPAEADLEKIDSLNYLQPYIAIALANLLVAHGSPDEAIDVVSQWLDLWRCARGEAPDGKIRAKSCTFGPVADAAKLPEWFSIRAEFELSILLYHLVGEQNITYRDFLQDHAKHFVGLCRAARPI